MIDKETGVFVPDFSLYSWNRAKFPSEELLKYPGEWVAFSPDGTRILAHGKEFEEVTTSMKARGLNPHDAVWDQLPPEGEDTIL
jgi:Family of unknown function (DUF5678)